MSTTKGNRKLKNYLFVNKAQVTIGLGNMLLLTLVFGIICVAILSPFFSDIFHSEDLQLQALSAKIFILLLERSAVAFGIIIMLVGTYQMIIVHRVCGPIVNFDNSLDALSKGDLTNKAHLRRHDFFRDEAEKLNQGLAMLTTVIGDQQTSNEEILADIASALEHGDCPEAVVEKMEAVKARTTAAIAALSTFKL
jgi:methyl-accepting chemotaxis protein